MIRYQLRCAAGHEFDGWFKNSDGFELQAASGFLTCPACGNADVARALMTPGIPRKGRDLAPVQGPEVPSVPVAAGGCRPRAG